MSESDYATAAKTDEGSLAVIYIPTVRAITVNMAALRSPTRARWFDPSNGTYGEIAGSPFANSGSKEFIAPGNNHDGDGDWVLLLEESVDR